MPREIILEEPFTKKQLLELTRLFAYEEGTCLLYSGGTYQSACTSYLCLFPLDTLRIEGQKCWRTHTESSHLQISSLSDPWEALKELLPKTFDRSPYPEWVGFIGYEMGAYSDREKFIPHFPAKTPTLHLQRCAIVIAVDHATDRGRVLIADQAGYLWNQVSVEWFKRLSNPSHWKSLLNSLQEIELPTHPEALISIHPFFSLEAYALQIERAKEWILAGEIYQLNLSQRLCLQGYRDPFNLFAQLVQLNPAPFSAYLRTDACTIVSSSPERFLKKKGSFLETRPIKGTMPRGATEAEDLIYRQMLLNSEKEKAELLMITDLMRNDLGKISRPGSVKTEQIGALEAYSNVYHLISIIQAQALDIHPVDILRACFPGGSITGCPKLRAMELISELEQRPRGIYTGSIGYLAGNGDFDFNIAIRTLVQRADEIEIQVGGAITADSDPQKEYEETLHKGASLLQALDFQGIPCP